MEPEKCFWPGADDGTRTRDPHLGNVARAVQPRPVRSATLAELSDAEVTELGPLLRQAASVAGRLVGADPVYACLWSHAGRKPGHLHFVVQPVTAEQITRLDAVGPRLQNVLFAENLLSDPAEIARAAERARALFRAHGADAEDTARPFRGTPPTTATDDRSIADLRAVLQGATDRLEATVWAMGPGALSEQSGLPDWSRAHVLTHLARNGDSLRNLLLAARTGAPLRMYASPETRAADIEVGAARPEAVILADVIEASKRFAAEAGAMPDAAWREQVAFTSGRPDPPRVAARRVLFMRLCEVEVHHVDLAADYGFADTPAPVAVVLLAEWAQRIGASLVPDGASSWSLSVPVADSIHRCRGTGDALLAWLAGRSEGHGVESDAAELPAVRVLG